MKTTTFTLAACSVAVLSSAADVHELNRRHRSAEALASSASNPAVLVNNTQILNTVSGTAASTLILAGSTPSTSATAKPSRSKSSGTSATNTAPSSKLPTATAAVSTSAATIAGAAVVSETPSSLPSTSVVHAGAAKGWDVYLSGFRGWVLSVLLVALVV
ncbi:hypothetical protein MN608_05664 [Microdochium nivale]|nr:hypothetical protein MN608_05664 [Microdochium nivale]